ncbi:ATP-dependent Clp protease ATP-binding subunit [Candidatus Dojkabacteria bacterium]|nr:ATP-dependent Clp protease ATP-binding subunit [Candidatus Dojkabacteria bacterium]
MNNKSPINDITNKFSQGALNALLAACKLAFENKRSVCTSAHLFQVLCKDPNVQRILGQINFDYTQVLNQVPDLLKNLQYPASTKSGVVVFSPDLRATILRSYLIEKAIPNGIVGVEDLIIATIYSPPIFSLIKKLDFDLSYIESFLNTVKGGSPSPKTDGSSQLSRFTINLIEKAQKGELDIVVDREKELAQITRILVREAKNNVILLGEVGVGRSSLVNLLTQRISSQQVPQQLEDNQILELNLSGLTSALVSRDFNEIIELFIEELTSRGNVIIFVKDFDLGTKEISIEKSLITNMLKSISTRKGVRLILSTTSVTYKELLTKEQAFSQKFETVKIEEPSFELSLRILENVAEKLSKYHKIKIPNDVIETAVILSKRYIQDKFLPSKAIDLLDEASSKAVLENKKLISVDDIRAVISEKTGIPIEKLTISEQKKLIKLEEILNQAVIGQKEAVHVVSEVVRRSRAGLKDPKKPIGSFLFLGPSGVGKTYLAKNLTRIVYDNENAMIRLDMSEFGEPHTVQRLIGSPPGYIGYEEGGQLTNPIWERPYSLILLDEIEKAHAKVFDIFLQVLDEGRLTDGQGRTVDFKNTIIIATSNIASEEILLKLSQKKQSLVGFERERFYEEEILPLLKHYFRPEFINRFDEIVIFNPLGIAELKIIAKQQINKIQERLEDKNIRINISDTKLEELARKSYKPAFGARPLIRVIQEDIENVLARKIISGEVKDGDVLNL